MPAQPAAVTAFLRGQTRRAQLFALAQCGDEAASARSLSAVAQVFAADAERWPLAQWPQQYWRLLLSSPALRNGVAAPDHSPLPLISRLPGTPRAAVLLLLVAGLDDITSAGVLGIEVAQCQHHIRDALPRNASGQPDLEVWRAWQTQVQHALARITEPLPAATGKPASASTAPAALPRRSWRKRVGLLALPALVAAVVALSPTLRNGLVAGLSTWLGAGPLRPQALPAADPPRARFDPQDPALHPDHALLAAPRELAFARDLPLLAWLAEHAAGQLPEPRASTPVSPFSTAATGFAQRAAAWQQLSPQQQARQRHAWNAWQALPAAERTRLRHIAVRLQALPAAQQQALRIDFSSQSFDARHGWWLGPTLGRDWPRLGALFAYSTPGQRSQLLQLLRSLSAEEIATLARLAQSLPPEARAEFRTALLQQSPAQRPAWLQQQLQN